MCYILTQTCFTTEKGHIDYCINFSTAPRNNSIITMDLKLRGFILRYKGDKYQKYKHGTTLYCDNMHNR